VSTPAPKEISDWLEKLCMSEYAQLLAENGIGIAALCYLTDQDLKEMGVLLGHRRVIACRHRGAWQPCLGTTRA
jgi:hypothetical protein